MGQQLRYGRQATLRLDLPSEKIVADWSALGGEPLTDPETAALEALRRPLDFPPVAQATAPGDRVAVPVDGEAPEAPALVAGVVRALLEGRCRPEDVAILRVEQEGGWSSEALAAALPASIRGAVRVVTHDPGRRSQLCYLAASRDARPIYFNRALFEADVVAPIMAARLDDSPGYLGPHGGLFPAFADEASQRRFRGPAGRNGAGRAQRRAEADEAAWLLGVQLAVHVVPGPGGGVLHVVAGQTAGAARRARRLCRDAWLRPAAAASLVVAAVDGGPSQQTWANVGRALRAASQVTAEDGAIVLLTELAASPGPAVRALGDHAAPQQALARIRRDRSPDALAAALVAETLGRRRVYLLSRLDEQLVEDLGFTPVAGAEDVQRLSQRYDSCILLAGAQFAGFAPRRLSETGV